MATIGAIAQATEGMDVTTAVTCPTMRTHPAVIAQAAATSAIRAGGVLHRLSRPRPAAGALMRAIAIGLVAALVGGALTCC
jgi:hypothetical protein